MSLGKLLVVGSRKTLAKNEENFWPWTVTQRILGVGLVTQTPCATARM